MPTPSIPQPWPAVSPDQAKRTERREAGAVRKRPTIGSETTLMSEIGCDQPVEDVLVRGQALDQPLHGQVGVGQRGDRREPHRVGEALGRRILHHHPRRPIDPGPDHSRGRVDVAGLHAVGEDRPRGALREGRQREARGDDSAGPGRKQAATTDTQRAGGEDHDALATRWLSGGA